MKRGFKWQSAGMGRPEACDCTDGTCQSCCGNTFGFSSNKINKRLNKQSPFKVVFF